MKWPLCLVILRKCLDWEQRFSTNLDRLRLSITNKEVTKESWLVRIRGISLLANVENASRHRSKILTSSSRIPLKFQLYKPLIWINFCARSGLMKRTPMWLWQRSKATSRWDVWTTSASIATCDHSNPESKHMFLTVIGEKVSLISLTKPTIYIHSS